jgi:GT2 family glycosyltransferase
MSGEPGIVVVTYNSAGVLAACLESALEQSAAVVVVDNLSSDNTCEVARRYPVQLITNRENRGFAAAVNQGAAALHSELILLLNPDARLLTPLKPMMDRLREPGVGAVGGRLLDEQRKDQAGFTIRRFPSATTLIFESLGINRLWRNNPVNRRYRALDADLTVSQETQQPAGAFFMFTRTVWQVLRGFDERFHPLWFEDVDFLQRASKAGYRIWYEPAACATHSGAHSIKNLQPSDRQRFWYGNLLRYASYHFLSDHVVRLVALSVLAGIGIRSLASGGSQQLGAGRLAWTYLVRGRSASE